MKANIESAVIPMTGHQGLFDLLNPTHPVPSSEFECKQSSDQIKTEQVLRCIATQLAIIFRSDNFTHNGTFSKSPFAETNTYPEIPKKLLKKQMKELREHWKAFEAFLQPKKYPVDNQFTGYFESKNRLSDGQLEKAQLKLQEILAILPEVHRCSSLIRPFLQSCDILLKGSLNNTDFVLTQAMLKHFYAETTTELNRVEGQRKWAYVHLAFYREPPRYLAPYDALMDALKMYNFWFGPGVESLQETIPQLALSIKQSAEVYWNYLVQQIQEYEQFCNPVDYELYFKDSYQSFIPSGTLITLYHRQLEEGLIQVRLTTSQQQIKNTLLYEEWLGLNQQLNLLNQIYDGHLEQELQTALSVGLEEEQNHKKTLKEIAGICRFDPVLKTKPLPSLFSQIVPLTEVKKDLFPKKSATKTDLQSLQAPEDKQQEIQGLRIPNPLERSPHPVISDCLLDLEALSLLNEQAKTLVKALEDSSFYYGARKQFRSTFIELIQAFNHCFNNAINPVEANLCLKHLIFEIQYNPDLKDLKYSNQNDIALCLRKFLNQYGLSLIDRIKSLNKINQELEQSSCQLVERIRGLKHELQEKEQLLQPAPEQELKRELPNTSPNKKALISRCRVM